MGASIRPDLDLDARIAKHFATPTTPQQPQSDTLDAKIAAHFQGAEPSKEEQFFSTIAQGATAGFGAKILGGLDAANHVLPKALGGDDAPLSEFGSQYGKTRDRIMGAESQLLKEHPIAGGATEMLSGAIPAVLTGGASAEVKGLQKLGTGARVARGVLHGTMAGAGYGGLSAAGHTTGGVQDYTDNITRGIAEGGIAGGVLGGALPAAGAVGGTILDQLGLRPAGKVPVSGAGRSFGGEEPVTIAPRARPIAPKAPQPSDPGFQAALEHPTFDRPAAGNLAKSEAPPVAGPGPMEPDPDAETVVIPRSRPPKGTVNLTGPQTGSTPNRAGIGGVPRTGPFIQGPPPEIPAKARGAETLERLGVARNVEPGQRGMGSPGYVAMGQLRLDQPGDSPILRALTPESLSNRSEGLLLKTLEDAGMSPEDALAKVKSQPGKPETFMETAGKAGARLGRTVRAASPKAGRQIDTALEQRALGASDRAINDALETSGLQQRTNGFQTTEDLIAQRSEEGKPLWEKALAENPIDNKRVNQILKLPGFQRRWAYAQNLMATAEHKLPEVTETVQKPIEFEGQKLTFPDGSPRTMPISETRKVPTVRSLHYWKLAVDDFTRPILEKGPGGGGSKYTEAMLLKQKSDELLDILKQHSPAYKAASEKYAQQSELIDAAKAGRRLFSTHPDQAAFTLKQMGSDASREVYRRAGMDALAERLENAKGSVAKGVEKPKDLKRIRLLFPDDATFSQFKERIAREAQMHETTQTVSKGSQTADKLADLADMMHIPLLGGPKRLATALLRSRGQITGRRLAETVAPDLLHGASGNQDELMALLQRLSSAADRQRGKATTSARTARAIGAGVGTLTGKP